MKLASALIAPCGMNCGICMGYLREKNHCPGCRVEDQDKLATCRECVIVNCEKLKTHNWKFCSDSCSGFPCKRLKGLDKRYSTKYRMSMLENLAYIKDNGIRRFIAKEETRWACPDCGGTINVHRKACSCCGRTV